MKPDAMTVSPPSPGWLERANRLALLSRILSGTVHDVNNALQVIGGSAELQQVAPGVTDAIRDRSRAIGVQARRASLLLADLADFARDTADRVEPVGLRAAAERAARMRQYALAKLGLQVVPVGDEVRVTCNSRHLLQIVLNLVVNAEQALAAVADRRLRIEVRREGDRGVLVVEDSGLGVPLDAKPTLFAARTDAAGPVGSLGLGLWVSRALAADYQGTVEHAGGGRFTLSLPVSRG